MKQPFLVLLAIFTGHIIAGCGGRFHATTGTAAPTTAPVSTTSHQNHSTGVTYAPGGGVVYGPVTDTTPPTTTQPPVNTGTSTPGTPNTAGDSVSKLTCTEAQFVRLINMYRSANGRGTLSVSLAGVRSSRWHAQDMINKNYFSHSEPDGRSFVARAANFGYSAWAENIAAGSSSAAGSFCQWKNSPGHNTNMLSSQHGSMGIGHISGGGNYGTYWSNNFGPQMADSIQEPLTNESGCSMPNSLPGC